MNNNYKISFLKEKIMPTLKVRYEEALKGKQKFKKEDNDLYHFYTGRVQGLGFAISLLENLID